MFLLLKHMLNQGFVEKEISMGNARQWKELNAKNQRVQTSFGDGSYWDYSYDDKGQITGAVKVCHQ